jgi:uncharacterized protein (TIGR01244 family)
MQVRQISDTYAVSPQISIADVERLKEAGFKSIICNRPDNEDPGQVNHAEIQAAAKAAGMNFRWLPVVSGQMTAGNVADQAAALDALPGPILAYCRSGTRSANLYAAVMNMRA